MKIRAVVTLPHVSGVARDACQNTFILDGPSALFLPGATLLVTQALANFYNLDGSAGVAVADYLSDALSRTVIASTVKYYDITTHLDGSNAGSPVSTDAFTLGPAGGATSLPEEVALVCTLRASGWATAAVEAPDAGDPGSAVDRPKQRRSGRLFLGPLSSFGLVEEASTFRARPSDTFRGVILDRAEALSDELDALDVEWHVWSRVDVTTRRITDAQVDNAWDTQRRRGTAATVRSTRTLVP